jgi:hypothetical protein
MTDRRANRLTRIAWSVLRNEKTFDIPYHEVMVILAKTSPDFATEKMHGTDR